ncbi:N-acetyltransferase B complex non catalytic subunit-domain-containing protein [Lipomyces oligophaga]|uniref:N-acetyltransferase B complex non catalytic subunit-domain-containing protein n=1 Tax=Lipomyces oligophaga TaxID=45792 RepID=UPI0034CD498C
MYRSNAVWDAIEAENYRLAHVQLAKALRRDPNDEYSLALQAYTFSLERKPAEAIAHARKLALREPTNYQTLELLYGIFVDIAGHTEAGQLYERAAKKLPKSEPLLLSWFWATSTGLDIRGQQRASMALNKAYGSNRAYKLRCAQSCYLAAVQVGATEMEQRLFAGLALRLLDGTGRPQTAEEAVLAARILEANPDKQEKLLEFLCDSETENWNNLELAVMKLETAVKLTNWEKVFAIVLRTLATENRDDYESYKQMAHAVIELQDQEKTVIFTNFLRDKSTTRNGALAAVYYASLLGKEFVLPAVKSYFRLMGKKQCAFDDLLPFVEYLDPTVWIEFCDEQLLEFSGSLNRASVNQLNILVNCRKFHYLLNSTTDSYVLENISLYNKVLPLLDFKQDTEYFYGDDLLLLAVQWILEGRPVSFPKLEIHDSVLVAVTLLESACSRDKHQFYVRLWLVRLHLFLGNFPQAQVHYKILSIKNIQMDTMFHHLFTRNATICPSFKAILENREIYNMNAVQTPQYIKYAYEAGSFSQIQGMVEFANRLTNSYGKGFLCVEVKRIARMTGLKMDELAISTRLLENSWHDNRDDDILKGIGSAGEEPIETLVRIGPKQDKEWINVFILRETILDLMPSGSKELDVYVAKLRDLMSLETTKSQLTKTEIWSMDILFNLYALIKATTLLAALKAVEDLKATFAELSGELAEPGLSNLTWSWFHNRFTLFETIKIIKPILDSLPNGKLKNPKLTQVSADLRRTLMTTAEKVKEDSRRIKDDREKWVKEKVRLISSYAPVEKLDSLINLELMIDGIAAGHDATISVLRLMKL